MSASYDGVAHDRGGRRVAFAARAIDLPGGHQARCISFAGAVDAAGSVELALMTASRHAPLILELNGLALNTPAAVGDVARALGRASRRGHTLCVVAGHSARQQLQRDMLDERVVVVPHVDDAVHALSVVSHVRR